MRFTKPRRDRPPDFTRSISPRMSCSFIAFPQPKKFPYTGLARYVQFPVRHLSPSSTFLEPVGEVPGVVVPAAHLGDQTVAHGDGAGTRHERDHDQVVHHEL